MATIARLTTILDLRDELTSGLESSMRKVEAIGARVRTIGLGMSAAVTLPIVAGVKAATNAASDLSEAQSAVMQVYADGAQQVIDWSKQSATAVGLSQEQFLSNMSVLGVYGDMLGMTGAETAAFSNELVTAAADLASFYNANTPDVLAAMQSALRGEFDPLEQYGILLNQATLEQYAMEQGIWDGSAAMTNQQKVMATQSYIMDNLGAAQGDFARTSDGLANSQRILRAQLQDVAASMGAVLLPAATMLASRLRELLTRFQALSGGTQKWIVIIALAAAAVGPLLVVMGTLMTSLTALAPVLALLAGPLGLVVALVGLLGLAYLKNWFGFGDAVNGAVKASGRFLKTLKQQYDLYRKLGKTPIEALFSGLGIVLENLTGLNLNEWFSRMGNAFQRPLDAIAKIKNALSAGNWRQVLAGFGDLLSAPAKLIGDFFKGIETGFKPLDRVFRELGNLITGFGRLIQEVFQGDWSGALDVAQGMLGNFRDLLGNVVDLAGNLGSQALDWVLNIGAPAVAGWILDGAQSLWDWLTGLYPKIKDLAGEILDWGIDVGVPAVKGAIVNAFTSAWEWVKGKVSWLADTITGAVESFDISIPIPAIAGDIVNAFGSVWDWIRSKIGWLVGVISAGGEADKTLTKSVGAFEISIPVPAIVGAIIDAFATVWDWIEDGVSWLAGFLSSDDALTKSLSGVEIDVPAPTIGGGIVTAFTSMWEAAKSVASWLVDTFEQTVTGDIEIDGAFKVIPGLKDTFLNAIASAMGWIWDGAGSVFRFVADVVMEATVSDSKALTAQQMAQNQGLVFGAGTGGPTSPYGDFVQPSGGPMDGRDPSSRLAPITVPEPDTTALDRAIDSVKLKLAGLTKDAPKVTVDADIAPATTAIGQATKLAVAWDGLTSTSTFDVDYAPAATAYTNASAFAETWAAATFTATFDADNGPAAIAYTDAFTWGDTWAGTTFTARFSVDLSPLETALVRTRQIAQEISDLLPHSPAKKGPLARPISFRYIADALRSDLGIMPGTTTDVMSRVRNGLNIGWPDGNMGLYGMGAAGNGFTNNGVVHIDADDPEGMWDALRRQGLAGARR